MNKYIHTNQRLISYCDSLKRAEVLEKSVMSEYGFKLTKENEFLYSEECSAVTDFFSSQYNGTPIGVMFILQQGKVIEDVIRKLKSICSISEEHLTRLHEAHTIRMNVYESLAFASL
jgi:hypothetical protein